MGLRRKSDVEEPAERRAAMLAELRRVVFEAPARSEPAVRAAAAGNGQLADPLGSYAAKVRDESYRVTDADVDALRAAGISEDEIFEVTVAAALGAACRRLDAGLRALREED
jgi:alkylhydroperoxidase family enzyme